jgi:AraC family transcriptional regulator of adaptative response / DNA-3-methyladenine glycosylase II
MELDPTICYQAVLTHDTRFDGAFFVGVRTTGIYCRTVCPARTPRQDRCGFYPSAAAAEASGFRPCLRCRPELAPGLAQIDAVSRLARVAAERIESGALVARCVSDLATDLGVSDRHLRRAVIREFGVSPIDLAQTQRLLFAKRLLTDTDLPITEVAFASGFASLRRFNALFQARYRLNPSTLRRARSNAPANGVLVCDLGFRPPYAWTAVLTFLGGRATPGVEAVTEGRYRRTIAWGVHRGWLAVSPLPHRHALRVELAMSLAPALMPILARVKRLFDLAADPAQIASHLGPLTADNPGLRVPGTCDGFELAVRAILGQQVSIKAATTLAGRFAVAFGAPIETPFSDLFRLTPTAARVATVSAAEIAGLGIIPARAEAIVALANAVAAGAVSLEPGDDVVATLTQLKALPGIGDWTAQYIAMRALSWPNAFPHTDLGIAKALGVRRPGDVLALAEAWQPWRAYAAMHLWQRLEKKH